MPEFAAILPLPAPPEDGHLGPLPPSQLPEQQNDEAPPENGDNNKANSAPATVATYTKAVGIIYPPHDIKNIVDKTSQFVAKNGPEFERRIVQSNAGNPKFNFLNPSNPYHTYYQHRLAEFRLQNQAPASETVDDAATESAPTAPAAPAAPESAAADIASQFKSAPKVLEPPEAEQYTVRLPEGITGEELDIIKLTAQFVARNGKSFLTGLTNAYSKVLMPPKGLNEKLRKSVIDMTTVLERCWHRLEWEKSQEQARQRAEDEIEQERMQMAMIDWHDFVVVETIDFADDEDEDLPPPMTLEEVIRRSKVKNMDEDIIEPGKEVEMEMDEEEVLLVEEGMRAASIEDNERKNMMKENEERIPAERDPTKYVVSPITGELIPINEMSEHMRISLIDPKFKEQKERMFAKIRETTLAQDDEISRNIVGLARTRPDIFGTTEEEVSNAVKAEIEKKKDEQPKQVIWDGHTGSIGRTANQALSQNVGVEDQSDLSNQGLPGPAAPPPRPLIPSLRPLPPPPGLALNLPRLPPNAVQYPAPATGGLQVPPPRPPGLTMMPMVRPPPPPMSMTPGQPQMMSNQQLQQMPPPGTIPGPPPHGAQFPPMSVPRPPFIHGPIPPTGMPIMPPPPPQMGIPPPPQMGMPPPPPPEEAPPPLPEKPEPKRQKLDDSLLVPEDQFLAQHPGPARINISVPNVDEGNLKGQVLEIRVQSISETVGNLKEKIAGEIQLPANKQKLSGKPGFLKDNLSLAYYNIGNGGTLNLSLRERGGRKR